MSTEWQPMLSYEAWSATCDTLHAHTQVLGKLAVVMAPAEPQLQHAALRLSARGWETLPLPVQDGSGALVVALGLRTHEAAAEHSDGRVRRVHLMPDRPVGEVTADLLDAVRELGGPALEIDPNPQEVPWSVPLNGDHEHATYDPDQVSSYFAAGPARRSCWQPSAHRIVADRRRSTRGGGRSTWRLALFRIPDRTSLHGLHPA